MLLFTAHKTKGQRKYKACCIFLVEKKSTYLIYVFLKFTPWNQDSKHLYIN